MADMHHYVQELIKGNLLTEIIDFDLDDNFKAIDRTEYESYIPDIRKILLGS